MSEPEERPAAGEPIAWEAPQLARLVEACREEVCVSDEELSRA